MHCTPQYNFTSSLNAETCKDSVLGSYVNQGHKFPTKGVKGKKRRGKGRRERKLEQNCLGTR